MFIFLGMNATTALTSAAASVPLTMSTCTTTTSTAASAASEMISNPISFNAFNAAAALGHLSSRYEVDFFTSKSEIPKLSVFSLVQGGDIKLSHFF